jgi:putative flavoprotein involved in K+ transport
MKIYQTIVVGGGPSGISCAYHLKQHNIDYLIIEKKMMLQTWRHERWDSFTLVTPNWMTNLPGVDHLIPYDNEFMTKKEIEHVLLEYMSYVSPNYVEDTLIESVVKEDGYYCLNTDNGKYYAEHIIVASGMFNQPFVPSLSERIPKEINQIHSRDYFNPSQLEEGNTLVVGAGRSGVQIALEIKNAGCEEVYLSVGGLTPLPVVYKNINGVYWLNKLSGYHEGKAYLPYKAEDLDNENIVEKINQSLYHCQIAGVEILGRFINCIDGKLEFSADLDKMMADGKSYQKSLEDKINHLMKKESFEVGDNEVDFDFKDLSSQILSPLTIIDANLSHLKNIIWCTGFKANYDWITLDIFDSDGKPHLIDGVSTHENVYFCGMELVPDKNTKSSFGVGLFALYESAKRAVDIMISRM